MKPSSDFPPILAPTLLDGSAKSATKEVESATEIVRPTNPKPEITDMSGVIPSFAPTSIETVQE